MKRRTLLAAANSLLAVTMARAETVGTTYPIAEPDMLKEIERTLREKEKSGELAKLQQEAIKRSEQAATNPKPVDGLRRTQEPRTYYFDPTVVANRRISTPDGKVIVEPGQRFNPLDQLSLPQWLIFFDARDAAQVRKAEALMKQADGRAKPILTGGSYIDIQKRWQRPVFFDQAGVLVRKLGIKQVPAVVTQEGKRLRIDELAV